MLIKKLQMLTYSYVLVEQKLLWLKMWNEFIVLQEAKNFVKLKFLNSQFNKWLHNATF